MIKTTLSDFKLQTSNFKLQTSDFRLQTSDFKLQTSFLRYNPYSLQYYSFWKRFFCVTVWQLTVSKNDFFVLQITDNSFGKEKNREDSVIVPTHYLLLENLLCDCNVLNISTPRKQKQAKETNWKQKFQKPQNENICLTYLNTEINGNFHFLSFRCALLKVQN